MFPSFLRRTSRWLLPTRWLQSGCSVSADENIGVAEDFFGHARIRRYETTVEQPGNLVRNQALRAAKLN